MQIEAIGIQNCGKKVTKLKGQHGKNMVPAPFTTSAKRPSTKTKKKQTKKARGNRGKNIPKKTQTHWSTKHCARERYTHTNGRKHMYKSCGANGSLEGCDFLSARILSTKSSHQPRGPLSFSLSGTQTHAQPHSPIIPLNNRAFIPHQRHKVMVVITIVATLQPFHSHSIHCLFCYPFNAHYMPHWMTIHSPSFFNCNCYANCVHFICIQLWYCIETRMERLFRLFFSFCFVLNARRDDWTFERWSDVWLWFSINLQICCEDS